MIPVVSLICVALLAIAWLDMPHDQGIDAEKYMELAEGHIENVVRTFANRILHPWLAGELSGLTGLNLDQSFLVLGCLSLVLLIATTAAMAGAFLPAKLLPLLLLIPFTLHTFQHYQMPDVFYAGLLGLFLWCLYREFVWFAVLLIFALQVTRESTLMLMVVFSIVCAFRGRWKEAAGGAVAMVMGALVVSYATSSALPNLHGMNQLTYMALKVPFNFLGNALGINLYSDTLAANNPRLFSEEPLLALDVSGMTLFGNVSSIGIYSFDPVRPLNMLAYLLTLFGVLPVVIVHSIVRYRTAVLKGAPVFVTIALVYGTGSYLLGTSIGASVDRLLGYGWPAFLIGVPYLLARFYSLDADALKRFLLTSFALAWLPLVVQKTGLPEGAVSGLVVVIAMVASVFAWRSLTAAQQPSDSVAA